MEKNVLVYTTPTCPHCDRVKSFLEENDISYEEHNVAQDKEKAKEMVKKTGQRGVPVTEVDGEFIVGYDEEKLKEALDL